MTKSFGHCIACSLSFVDCIACSFSIG
jgi:hypothetical protein